MSNFISFGRKYFKFLKELVQTISDRAMPYIPACLTNTSFVIIYSDITDRHLIWLISKSNTESLIINGKEIKYTLQAEPIYLTFNKAQPLEKFLFPHTVNNQDASFTIREQHVVLDGLAFSNKDYNSKYWKEAKFVRFTAGEIPFYVDKKGSMLGLDLLYGFEVNSERNEFLFEYIKIFGSSEMIPTDIKGIKDMVFRDFVLATSVPSRKYATIIL